MGRVRVAPRRVVRPAGPPRRRDPTASVLTLRMVMRRLIEYEPDIFDLILSFTRKTILSDPNVPPEHRELYLYARNNMFATPLLEKTLQMIWTSLMTQYDRHGRIVWDPPRNMCIADASLVRAAADQSGRVLRDIQEYRAIADDSSKKEKTTSLRHSIRQWTKVIYFQAVTLPSL